MNNNLWEFQSNPEGSTNINSLSNINRARIDKIYIFPINYMPNLWLGLYNRTYMMYKQWSIYADCILFMYAVTFRWQFNKNMHCKNN